MMRLPRRTWVLIAVVAALVFGTILLQLLTPAANATTLPRGTTLSAAPQGSLALSQWLEAEGYGVERVRVFPFTGDGLAALFVIVPAIKEISPEEAADIAGYVERGGTLILVTDGNDGTTNLQNALDLAVAEVGSGTGATATPDGPTLARPPVATIALQSTATVRPRTQADPRFLSRATSENGTVVATMTRGNGQVRIVAGPYPLSNAGLPAADNLALVQNLLAGLPVGARIGFDEYHHGYRLGSNIADLALRSPWGWALFYLAGLTLVAFVLGGRRFGQSLPAPPVPPKAPAAYARALGDRWREGKEHGFAQTHLAARLKGDLAALFSLDPPAADDAFVGALHTRRPDLAAECAALLTALGTP
ncbi:MAG: DUF4350 domain-containing protein, partial [Thermomicrobia bacterium]|nr:DUF4350 domain-containing protein [Thermomicrobia bacterium]